MEKPHWAEKPENKASQSIFLCIFLWLSVFEPLLIYICQPQLVWGRKGKRGIWNCSERMFAERLQKSRTELRKQLPLGLVLGERESRGT